MRKQQGFTLIELIIVMVIMGILLTVGALFFTTIISGLTTSRLAVEIGQTTQLSMDRIMYELKHATNRTASSDIGFAANTNIIFESTATGLTGTTRAIELVGTNLVLDVDGTDHILLENVNNFIMTLTEANIDGAAGNEISRINMSFQVTGYGGTFSLEASPRQFIRL